MTLKRADALRGPLSVFALWVAGCLIISLALFGCADDIEVAEPSKPPSTSGQPIVTEAPSVVDRDRIFSSAADLSIAARAPYAAIGRDGASPSVAAGTYELLQFRRPALPLLINDLEQSLQAFEAMIAERHTTLRLREELEVELSRLRVATDHLVSTTEAFIAGGRFDRIHHLYVDRVDEILINIVRMLLDQQGSGGSNSLVHLTLNFLNRLEEAHGDGCTELQCGLYGVDVPLSPDARLRLVPVASRLIAVRPAMRNWIGGWAVPESTREVLRDILQSPWTASRYWAAEMFDLINGADEMRRNRHPTARNTSWPIGSVYLAERLLLIYVELLSAEAE